MRRIQRAATRLADGSGLIWATFTAWLWPGCFRTTAVRYAGSLAAALFVLGLLLAAPGLMWVLTVVWCAAAWRMSVSSATPPPAQSAPSRNVSAVETGEVARVERGPEGVTCTVHMTREEVPEP